MFQWGVRIGGFGVAIALLFSCNNASQTDGACVVHADGVLVACFDKNNTEFTADSCAHYANSVSGVLYSLAVFGGGVQPDSVVGNTQVSCPSGSLAGFPQKNDNDPYTFLYSSTLYSSDSATQVERCNLLP